MIRRLLQEKHPVLYFFFRHSIAANHEPRAALRDWLVQVLKFSPPLQEDLRQRVEGHGDEANLETLKLEDLFDLLRIALSHLQRAYIVVDGLDEMDQESLELFLQHFQGLSQWRPREVKLIMTSRPVAFLEKVARKVQVLDMRLDKQRIHYDIDMYVKDRLRRSSTPIQDQPRTAENIINQSDGLFLYAKLVLDCLERSPGALDSSISAIPPGLSVVYSNIIDEQSRRTDIPNGLRHLVLQLVTHATRPLRLLEISDLVNVAQEIGDLGATKDLIRTVCGPLLEVLPDETVHVIHHSLTEFLNGTTRDPGRSTYPVFEPGPTHDRLAKLCISYLQAGCLDSVSVKAPNYGSAQRFSANQPRLPPFTWYAASNWHVHVRKATQAGHDQTEMNRQILDMFANQDVGKLGFLSGASKTCRDTPIGVVTSLKLTSVAKELLALSRFNPEVDQGAKDASLQHAVTNGDVELVELLTKYGADPTARDKYGSSSLHLAVHGNCHCVAEALLNNGVDPFIPQGENKVVDDMDIGPRPTNSPAHYVFRMGDTQMVSVFLPFLKTAEAINWALVRAVKYHRRDAIQHLLGHPLVDVNSKPRDCTPLFIACAHRDAESIDLLLKAGADPNIVNNQDHVSDGTGYNAIHALAGRGYPFLFETDKHSDEAETRRCFKMVLQAGGKIGQIDNRGCTPMHIAADPIAVECLLDVGASPNITNRAGETLLHKTRNEGILQILASRADINAKTEHGGFTPLLSALKEVFTADKFKINKAISLLDLGADPTMVDNEGNSSLHYAVGIHQIEGLGLVLLERLLAGGADANLKNKKGQTPLHQCLPGSRSDRHSMKDDLKVMDMLLAAGADLEIMDENGQTPLFQMMNSTYTYNTDEKINACKHMIAAGARIHTTNLEGKNVLHGVLQSRWPGDSLIRFLVTSGIDPQQTDSKGNTFWHLATPELAKRVPDHALLTELTTLGVDPEKTNNSGQSPLHIVVQYHPSAFQECNSSSNGRLTNADDECFFDYFIGMCTGIDSADNDGVTPLHLASTFSEYLTRRLLEEGASPKKTTVEGLTPLHLVARSRQTGTLCILLARLSNEFGKGTAREIVNARDSMARSALYYGCASGRVEIVQLLVNAGAVVHTESYTGSPWEGCIALQYEEDTAKWRWEPGRSSLDDEPDAAGVLIADTQRTKLDLERGSYHSRFPFRMERLDEIVYLLVEHGRDSGFLHIGNAISSAIERKFDHATECLLHAFGHLGMKEAYRLDEATSARLSQRTKSLYPPSKPGDSLATTLMGRRQYNLATQEISHDIEKLLEEDKLYNDMSMPHGTILHYLVSGGFTTILDSVLRPETVHAIKTRQDFYPTPLLVEACRRDRWNMNVVRLLVETKRADLNATALQFRAPGWGYGSQNGPTVLHVIIREGSWWQVMEALPYLLSRGANIEARDERGITPLCAALEAIKGPHFSMKAVETLLQFGADPNATDDRSQSCLTRAGGNREVYRLLLRHGANVSPSTMVDVINRQDIDLLETILTGGVDPNLRQPGKEVPSWTSPDGTGSRPARSDPDGPIEQYPLEVVAEQVAWNKGSRENSERMLKLLLENGANPSARYEATTVMHRIIRKRHLIRSGFTGESQFLRLLLNNPKLDLEAQEDKCGMTLLLYACAMQGEYARGKSSEKRTLVKLLIDAGANVCVADKKGRNALHLLFTPHSFEEANKTEDIHYLTAADPELVHAVDGAGKAPLHAAVEMPHVVNSGNVDDLIKAGSDALASVRETGDHLLHLLFRKSWTVIVNGTQTSVSDPTTTEIGDKHNSLFQRLIAMGADVNARNFEGETPIFAFFR